LRDSLQYDLDVDEHLSVQEANHAVAALLDQFRTPGVSCHCVDVLSAVELDHEPRVGACEVGNKIPDRKLPPEAEVGESSGSKTRPKLLFCFCLIAAESACAIVRKENVPSHFVSSE
jgi:hypothetical protein